MIETAEHGLSGISTPDELLGATRACVEQDLQAQTVKIDLEGHYPEAVMRRLGTLGVYRAHLSKARADGLTDMGSAIQAMAAVSHECLSTGFSIWCQDTCGWYLQNAANNTVRENWLECLAGGEVLGGTGMSNTMKAFAGIEELRLSGTRVDGGYIVNGALPWVSNLGADHVFGTLFKVKDQAEHTVMALIDCASEGFSLRQSAHFTALEGTRTFACIFEDVFVPDAMIIDEDGAAFLRRARTGIVLLQLGMAAGNIQSCIDICNEAEPLLGHVNQYLDDRPVQLQEELEDIIEVGLALAGDPYETAPEYFREVLQIRLAGSELALRASQSAMLHSGAKGYLQSAGAQRKLRESYFIAIVTPAIKHLRKELAQMQVAA